MVAERLLADVRLLADLSDRQDRTCLTQLGDDLFGTMSLVLHDECPGRRPVETLLRHRSPFGQARHSH